MFRTISNKIAAAALAITMVMVLTLGGASYLFTRWNLQTQITDKLTFEASLTQGSLESILSTINQEVKNLSENLVLVNALIDSEGRDIYIGPFMKGYKLPYALPFTLTLCDFQGNPVIASQLEMQGYTDNTILKEVIEGGKPLAAIREAGEEKNLLIIYPILYSYTGLPEGMLVLTVPFAAIIDSALSLTLDDPGKMLSLLTNGQEIWGDTKNDAHELHSISSHLNLDAPLARMALAIEFSETAEIMHSPLLKLTFIYVIIGITVLLVTLGLSRIIAHHLTLPLQTLAEAANKITRTGVPEGQIDIKGDDEVKQLSSSFNTMIKKLLESQLSLEQRVQERTEELEALNQKSQHYADSRNVLLREVNHRVKNNLTAIISMLHQEEDRVRADDTEESSKTWFRSSEVVGRISGLLTVHSLLSSSEWAPLSLSQLAQSIIQRVFKGVPAGKAIDLEVFSSDIYIDSDQAHYLAIVLNELATNTMKYAFAERDVAQTQVKFHHKDDSIVVEYHDDGPGYPEFVLHGEIPKTCTGFHLIGGIVSKSLQGKIELLNKNGAMARIIFSTMKSESENEASNDE